MIKEVENKISEINELCNKHSVKSLFLFGSANTNSFNNDSDIDLLISFKTSLLLNDYADNYFDLKDSLKDLFNRRVDLVVEKSLKNPYFLKEIEETKIKIYGA